MRENAYPGFVIVLNCTDQTLTSVSISHSCGSTPRISFAVTALAPGDCATKTFTSQVDTTDTWTISLESASGRTYTGRLAWEYTQCDSPQGVIIQLALDQWFVVNPVAARGEASYRPNGPLEAAGAQSRPRRRKQTVDPSGVPQMSITTLLN